MTISWMAIGDPETVVVDGNGLMFAFCVEVFGRDPHEYVKSKTKVLSKGSPLSKCTVTHSPLHRKDRKVLAVKEFFENKELMEKYCKKITQFVMGSDDIIKLPFVEVMREVTKTVVENGGGRLLTQCIDLDLKSIWYSDVYYKTNVFPNGPYFKSRVIPEWNSIRFVCSRRWFTSSRLNAKMLERYPEMIDTTLEGLVKTIRGDLTFLQSHRPQDDVDLLIEVVDHVYSGNISKQDFWDLLRMDHDFYDNKPATIFSPGGTRLHTVESSLHSSLKN